MEVRASVLMADGGGDGGARHRSGWGHRCSTHATAGSLRADAHTVTVAARDSSSDDDSLGDEHEGTVSGMASLPARYR